MFGTVLVRMMPEASRRAESRCGRPGVGCSARNLAAASGSGRRHRTAVARLQSGGAGGPRILPDRACGMAGPVRKRQAGGDAKFGIRNLGAGRGPAAR